MRPGQGRRAGSRAVALMAPGPRASVTRREMPSKKTPRTAMLGG